MKKTLIIASLLAICSVAATAASVKTSKAVPLNDTQMESVKGQGLVYVYVWCGTGYQLVGTSVTPCGDNYAFHNYYNGGPLNGVTTNYN